LQREQLGWTVGQNVQIDYRWSAGSEDDTRKYAAELVALAPDVIFASGAAAIEPLQRATRTVPIVFVLVPDPVGAGFISSMARPGGNITGFTQWDYSMAAKWLALRSNEAARVQYDAWRHGDLAANCRPRITAGRNQFSGANQRNNTGAG